MTALSVTNTLSNGATILASEHNTNYSDIVTYINNRNSGSATWDVCSVSSGSTVPVIINNSTGTQDILRCQDNGSNVLVVADGGIVTMASQSAARAYRNTSTQSLSIGAITVVAFNAESYDVQSEFDSSTNYRFTAAKAGKYIICSSITFGSAATIIIYIYKNGSIISGGGRVVSASGNASIVDTVSLSASDYIDIRVESSATNTVVNGEGSSYVAIHKVA